MVAAAAGDAAAGRDFLRLRPHHPVFRPWPANIDAAGVGDDRHRRRALPAGPLPARPGRHGERRPARTSRPDRQPQRPAQPPGAAPRCGAQGGAWLRSGSSPGRSRRVQAGQRHLRPCGRRHGAQALQRPAGRTLRRRFAVLPPRRGRICGCGRGPDRGQHPRRDQPPYRGSFPPPARCGRTAHRHRHQHRPRPVKRQRRTVFVRTAPAGGRRHVCLQARRQDALHLVHPGI